MEVPEFMNWPGVIKNKEQPVYPLWIFLDKNQNLVYYQEGLLTPEKNEAEIVGDFGFAVGWEMLRRNFSCM